LRLITLPKLLLLSLLCLLAQSAWADTIDDWLDKMSQASQQQNFQGTLVIRQQDKMQAIRVKQGVTPKGSWQTLESLTGEDQTIIRHNNKVTTIFPAKKLVTISDELAGALDKGPLHPALPENREALKKLYNLELGGHDRIANKSTQKIQMIPRDQHRYGYVFWLDQQSGLLLKCDLLDEKGKVLEQLMYSDIELLSSTPKNSIDVDMLKTYRKVQLMDEQGVRQQRWQASKLPVGFELIRAVKVNYNSRVTPTYHMVYSDGMASLSVFVEQRKEVDKPVIGMSSMGPVNAYSSFMDNDYVTVIGEVPSATVRMIAESIKPLN
jgi:sigma-E factor negative regulatory protein RseB